MNFVPRRALLPVAFCALAGFLLGAADRTPAEAESIEAPVVRVLVAVSSDALVIKCSGRLRVEDARTHTATRELEAGGYRVSGSPRLAQVGPFEAESVRVTPVGGKALRLNGKPYPGSFQIWADARGDLYAVNLVDLESYVAGVVGEEIGYSAPLEAQKAQAIAARTYAVAKARTMRAQFPKEVFDLFADTRSQVYGGNCGNERVWQAVWATRGRVLTDRGTVFPAYYHATCGGVTEAAERVFPMARTAPLAGGVRCDWCKGAARRVWTATLTEWRIRTRLNASGFRVGAVSSIAPCESTATGRNAKLLIRYSASGKSGALQLAAGDFRAIAGDDAIRSTRFRVVRVDEGFLFEGEGWGHGVGMCQEGAIAMARAGWKCDEILATYYPGNTLVRAYGD